MSWYWASTRSARSRFDRITAKHGDLPKTAEATTAAGGRHLYFQHPTERVGTGALPPGLTLRSDGTAWSPRRRSTPWAAPTTWTRHPYDVGLANAPDWLLDMLSGMPRDDARRQERETAGEARAIIHRLSEVSPEHVEWLWEERIPRGKLSMIQATRDSGSPS